MRAGIWAVVFLSAAEAGLAAEGLRYYNWHGSEDDSSYVSRFNGPRGFTREDPRVETVLLKYSDRTQGSRVVEVRLPGPMPLNTWLKAMSKSGSDRALERSTIDGKFPWMGRQLEASGNRMALHDRVTLEGFSSRDPVPLTEDRGGKQRQEEVTRFRSPGRGEECQVQTAWKLMNTAKPPKGDAIVNPCKMQFFEIGCSSPEGTEPRRSYAIDVACQNMERDSEAAATGAGLKDCLDAPKERTPRTKRLALGRSLPVTIGNRSRCSLTDAITLSGRGGRCEAMTMCLHQGVCADGPLTTTCSIPAGASCDDPLVARHCAELDLHSPELSAKDPIPGRVALSRDVLYSVEGEVARKLVPRLHNDWRQYQRLDLRHGDK